MMMFLISGMVFTTHGYGQKAVAKKTAFPSCCQKKLPSRFSSAASTGFLNASYVPYSTNSRGGMVWIKGGEFVMGCSDKEGREDEYPQHRVKVDGFWMDQTEVTNAQFKAFVDATGYVTTAEKAPDWEELKQQLPPGTPKPADSLLVAASLVFTPPSRPAMLQASSQWWNWSRGANWRQPQGPAPVVDRRCRG